MKRQRKRFIIADYVIDETVTRLGGERFGKRPLPSTGEGIAVEMFSDNGSWRQDGQFFAGVEFAFSDNLALMAEYSPIRYDEQTSDPAQAKYFTEPVPSRYNFGLRWRPYEWLQTDLTYQRGNQVGVNVCMPFEMGRPMIPIYDPPYREHPQARTLPIERRTALKSPLTPLCQRGVRGDFHVPLCRAPS